jgi:hypothetical protein
LAFEDDHDDEDDVSAEALAKVADDSVATLPRCVSLVNP